MYSADAISVSSFSFKTISRSRKSASCKNQQQCSSEPWKRCQSRITVQKRRKKHRRYGFSAPSVDNAIFNSKIHEGGRTERVYGVDMDSKRKWSLLSERSFLRGVSVSRWTNMSTCHTKQRIGGLCRALRKSFSCRGNRNLVLGLMMVSVLTLSSIAFGFQSSSLLRRSMASKASWRNWNSNPIWSSTTRSKLLPTSVRAGIKEDGGNENGDRVNLVVVAPLKARSTLNEANWDEVLSQMALRLSWADPTYHLSFIDVSEVPNTLSDISKPDIVFVIGARDLRFTRSIASLMDCCLNAVALDSSEELSSHSKVSGLGIESALVSLFSSMPSPIANIIEKLIPIGSKARQAGKVMDLLRDLYSRKTSDDLLYSFLVMINAGVRPVPAVANDARRSDAGLDAVICMVGNCLKEIGDCFKDPTCRKALDCLNGCAFNDQVCSYLCIASYETPALQEFSLCILQKHNCLGLKADIPQLPEVEPLKEFRGQPLTHEIAEDMFIGWLSGTGDRSLLRKPSKAEPFSWRVFAGKNAAYDHFPCQFQLFYPGKGKAFWYQPIFQVETLSGERVWRDRLYRVRRGKVPGSFHLSVLDNGVTSNEFWRVLDCDENLNWCAWFYSGAASAAGMYKQ